MPGEPREPNKPVEAALGLKENVLRQYREVRPIRDSKVRREQERQITKDVNAGTPVAVRGVWRMGKTSMVSSIQTHAFAGEGIYADVSVASNFRELKWEFSFYVANYIARKDRAEADRLLEEIESSGQSPLAYFEAYLAAHDTVAYLTVDEVVALRDSSESLDFISSISQYPHIRTTVVLHAVASYEAAFQKHFGNFKTYFVEPLSLADAAILIREPLIGTSVQVTDAAVAAIVECAGGRPMSINSMCASLFSSDDGQLIFDAADVWRIAENNRDYFRQFENIFNNYKKVFEHALGDEHRMMLVTLIDRGVIPFAEADPGVVNFLVNTTFVRADETRGGYVINGRLFENFLKEQVLPFRRSL